MLLIAHRGVATTHPENTPAAFAAAASLGADGVELDVRAASDRLVVHHDPLPHDAAARDTVPSLTSVLDACDERLLVNVEVKVHVDDEVEVDWAGTAGAVAALVDPVVEELLDRGDESRWLISSFSWAAIGRSRLLAPDLATAYLVESIGPGVVEQTAAAGHVALHPWVDSLTPDHVAACHAQGLAVMPWTCNDRERLVELASWGVDAACTDVVTVALDALGRGAHRPTVRPRWGRPA